VSLGEGTEIGPYKLEITLWNDFSFDKLRLCRKFLPLLKSSCDSIVKISRLTVKESWIQCEGWKLFSCSTFCVEFEFFIDFLVTLAVWLLTSVITVTVATVTTDPAKCYTNFTTCVARKIFAAPRNFGISMPSQRLLLKIQGKRRFQPQKTKFFAAWPIWAVFTTASRSWVRPSRSASHKSVSQKAGITR
jgi:hypothetical protein